MKLRSWCVLGALLSVFGACPRPATARLAVAYNAVDAATVRVFAVQNVEVAEGRTRQGATRQVALPNMGHGTGFSVGRGYILTAAHVIEGAHHIVVRLPGEGGYFPARVASRDEENDIAVLYVDRTDLPALRIAEATHRLQSRQQVFAVGYPLDPSRTQAQSARGIVSGMLEDGRLQLDMDLNPGNSGGPLIDDADTVVGMVVARGDVERGVQGIGVAVPLSRIHAALGDARQRIVEGRASELPADAANAARVVDTLSRLRLLRIMRDVSDIVDRGGDTPAMAEVEALADVVTQPDLQVLVAAYLWDAAQVLMFRAGDYVSPSAMPAGASREMAQRWLTRATALLEAAEAADPTVADRSPFLRVARGGRGAVAAGAGLDAVIAAFPPMADPPPAPSAEDLQWRGNGGLRLTLIVGGGIGLLAEKQSSACRFCSGYAYDFSDRRTTGGAAWMVRFGFGVRTAVRYRLDLFGELGVGPAAPINKENRVDTDIVLGGEAHLGNFGLTFGARFGVSVIREVRKAGFFAQGVIGAGIRMSRSGVVRGMFRIYVGRPLFVSTFNIIFRLGSV